MGAAPPSSERAGTGDPGRWPLVGRDDELALARSAVAAHGGVVLAGAAGVGKTRLALEVLATADTAGHRTEWAVATHSAATVPLGAVAHLVPSAAIGRGRDATLRAMVAALERGSSGERLVLGIDDAHLLDDASAALVHLLVTSGVASVVATVRSGEPAPDPIIALWKDGPAPLIALQPLAQPEVEQLVTTVLDGLVDGAALHFLWGATRGNALFVRELVRDGLESGALRCEADVWQWRGPLEPGERLHDLVAMRMGRLDEGERDALEVLAVGEPLTVECLRALGAADIAEQLERRGLAVASRRGEQPQVRLAHPLFGEVVRAETPAARLDEVRRRAADALESTGDPDPADLLRIATWRADAGDRSRPDQLRAAARRAWVLGDAPVAERLARAALEAGPELEAGYLLGEALSDRGRPEEALAAWRAVEHLPGPDRVQVSLAAARAGVLAYQLDQPAEAVATLRDTAARIGDEAARRRLEGWLALFTATHPSADAVASESAPSSPGKPDGPTPSAALAAVLEWTGSGQLELAVRTADDAMALGHEFEHEQPTMVELLRMTRVRALALAGHIAEAEAEADRGYTEAVREGADLLRARWSLVRGIVAVLRGRSRTAVAALREASVVLETADMGWLRPARAYLAMAVALTGDEATARRVQDGAEAGSRTLDRVFEADVTRAHGWVRAARGEVTEAARAAGVAADQAAAGGQATLEALARHDVARFGRAGDVVDRLEELAGVVDGALVDAMSAHARALADDDGAGLDEVSSAFAALDLDLFAAEAAAAAAGVHDRAGKKASALGSTRRARELAERCEGGRTPALVRADQPDELTGREREVAELAARGLTDRDIADALFVSVRTVHAHLRSTYAKLGVTGRHELAAVLGTPTAPK